MCGGTSVGQERSVMAENLFMITGILELVLRELCSLPGVRSILPKTL
jgi:hypothetical protein